MVWVEHSALQTGSFKRGITMAKQFTDDELEWAEDQILMWIDNDRPTYDRKIYIFRNLEKKKDKGIYDPVKAEKAFNYLTTDVRRMLNRESRESMLEMIGTTMPVRASVMADRNLRLEFEAWYNEEKEMRAS